MEELFEDIKLRHNNITLAADAIFTAHKHFVEQHNAYLALHSVLQLRLQEVKEREAAVAKQEVNVKEKDEKSKAREKKCTEREQHVEQREKEVQAKEKIWSETEERMAQNAGKIAYVVHLNVGGTRFSFTKDKLLYHKGSLFEEMLVSNHSQQLPATGEFYIDRDPKYFKYISNFLRHGTVTFPVDKIENKNVTQEVMFYKLPFIFQGEGHELVGNTKFANEFRVWLPNCTFQLIFKATRDGFGGKELQKHCYDKGPTLVVVQSNKGYLFGGYTPLSWENDKTWKSHADMFIFTLSNPHNIPPSKYPLQHGNKNGIVGDLGVLQFGGGFFVSSNSNKNTASNTRTFPLDYEDTTKKGNITFTGELNFTTKEIEVFSVNQMS